jgi:hypothetical protein
MSGSLFSLSGYTGSGASLACHSASVKHILRGMLPELLGHVLVQGPRLWERGHVRQFVVYGLGTLEQGAKPPLYQLAFAQILRGMVPNLAGPPECYDPVFGSVDTALLESLGYKVCHMVHYGLPSSPLSRILSALTSVPTWGSDLSVPFVCLSMPFGWLSIGVFALFFMAFWL